MDQADLCTHGLTALEALGARYAVIGTIASSFYGEPRFTHDLDVVIGIEAARESLGIHFPADRFQITSLVEKSLHRQFNVIHPRSGNKIDFMVERSDSWGKMQLARRRRVELFTGQRAYIAAPEDIILGKLLYYREGESPKHLRDIAAMLQVSGDEIDRDDVTKWATELGVLNVWQAILTRLKDAEAAAD